MPVLPGPVLKSFRNRLGLTQERLAERLASLAWERGREMVGVDRAMISKWERGVRRPRKYYRELLCLLYETTPETLGFHRPAPRCECASARLGGVERRELLRLLGAASALVSPGIGELAAAQPGVLAVDDPVHSVRSITHHYRRLWATTPTQDLTGPVLGHLRLADTLLEASRSEADRVRLAVAASETAVLAAWLAEDSWDHAAARRHNQAAIAYAERAGNDLLRAYTLADTSYWAARTGDGDEAVRRIERAQSLLPPEALPACGVDLWGLEAVARASAHDPSAALHALGHAESLLQRSEEQDEAPWPWVFPVNYGLLARYRVEVAIECKLPRMALPLLEEALKDLGAVPTKRHAYTLSNLAYVNLLSGEIEEACRLAGEALAIAVLLNDKESMQRIKEIRDRLAPWKATRAVAELDERLGAPPSPS